MTSVINKSGFEFLECISLNEQELKYFEPLAGSYAVFSPTLSPAAGAVLMALKQLGIVITHNWVSMGMPRPAEVGTSCSSIT